MLTPREKAAEINRSAQRFGTFAEIGAGQEVVRWFFHAGHASATVAKSISAYDTAVSDDLYGPAEHYVSRRRLQAMLDREYSLLLKRSDAKHGEHTCFFVFADTAATQHESGGHAWVGLRFQIEPRSEPSEIIAHVQLLDATTLGQQRALGVLGVNFLHAVFSDHRDPSKLIGSFMDDLNRRRIEVDLIRFSGGAFDGVDNRLMSLHLVEQELTDAVMFTVDGEVEQASEVISGNPVLLERGAFRPVTNITREMLDSALEQLRRDPKAREPVVLMEMTLNNLLTGRVIDHQDFLARVDTLGALGKMVMISNYARFDRVISFLRKYTRERISLVLGAPTLIEIFNDKYYRALEGGLLEGLGRLFRDGVKLYVYPMKTGRDGAVIDAKTLAVPPDCAPLYDYLWQKGHIEAIRQFREDRLHVYPADVLARIQSGDSEWEKMVPRQAAVLIKQRKLFGYNTSRQSQLNPK